RGERAHLAQGVDDEAVTHRHRPADGAADRAIRVPGDAQREGLLLELLALYVLRVGFLLREVHCSGTMAFASSGSCHLPKILLRTCHAIARIIRGATAF